MPAADVTGTSARVQQLHPVCADGLQHREARLTIRKRLPANQTVLDE